MSAQRHSPNPDPSADPVRLGTIRRFQYSIAISLVYEDDRGRMFRLVCLPSSGGHVLGEITCQDGQASPLWDEGAANIDLENRLRFVNGLIRTVLAIDAARDGTPIDLEDHGLRLDRYPKVFLPTVQEIDA